jgi:hypothetical protein
LSGFQADFAKGGHIAAPAGLEKGRLIVAAADWSAYDVNGTYLLAISVERAKKIVPKIENFFVTKVWTSAPMLLN